MSAPHIILDCLPSLCQKLSDLEEVWRREEGDCVKRILEANVGGQRSRVRQRKRWIDVVKHNMEDLQLNVEDAENRAE